MMPVNSVIVLSTHIQPMIVDDQVILLNFYASIDDEAQNELIARIAISKDGFERLVANYAKYKKD